MGGFLVLKDRVEVPAGVKVVKAAEYARFVEAQQVVAAAREVAARMAQDARAAHEEEKKLGREEGVLEGKMEMADRMLEGVSRSVDYLEGMENTVVDVVMKSLNAVLGEMSEKDLVFRLVRKALHQVRDQKKIVLKVSAEDADTVQGRLDELVRAYPGIGLVDVVADSRLTKGQCVLETEIGVIDASLDKQLEIIEKSFRQHLSSART